MSERFRWVVVAGVGLAALAATLLPVSAAGPATVTREFTLTAAPVEWEIQPGLVVQGWGYNGQVPGPELRAREGDRVRVHLQNRLPVPTTLHWHGIDVPLEMDGVPGLSQDLVEPGADFTYEFTATNPGTRWYHSHVDSNAQLELGLYGAFIIEPAQPEPVVYDREFTYLLDEKALDFTPEVALGQARLEAAEAGNGRGGLLQYDLFLINGKAGEAIPPLEIGANERIRVRLINAGNLVHAMHLHGHSFSVVATDGNPVPEGQRWVKDTVLIGPGERYDLEIRGTNPGVWMFHCHMPNHQDNGMMTTLVYAGAAIPSHAAHDGQTLTPAATANTAMAATPATANTGATAAAGMAATLGTGLAADTAAQASTDRTDTPGAGASAGAAGAGQSEGKLVAGQDLSVSVVDNRFEPPTLTVPVGATVVWSNTGLNLHTATAFDGSFDSGTISPGASAQVTFDHVGTFRYYCRQHLLGGMIGIVHVVSEV